MGFLAPLWLLAGAAAAVPLLIHLMRRRAGLRIDFPAVRYLVRAEREHSRDLRLRNLLLMILRVAAVLLITLAAAHPIVRMAGGERIEPHVGEFNAGRTFTRYYWQLELDEQLRPTGREIVPGGPPNPR